MKLEDTCSLKEIYDQPRQHIKRQKYYFANKCPSSQSYGFSSSRVWIWELDYKESWALKNWCFWSVVWEKTLESPLDCKVKPVDPKGSQSWLFIGRNDAEAETPVLWPPDVKNWHIWKDPDAGKDWRQEEKGTQRIRWLDCITNWWIWVWASSRSWWWTGKPVFLLSMPLNTAGLWEGTGDPTPVLLPGKSHGWRSLVGCSPWGCEKSDDWATSLSLFTFHFHFSLSLLIFMHWRRKWQPAPVFLPGESQGWEPGGLLSMGSHRVGHDWRDLAAAVKGKLEIFP